MGIYIMGPMLIAFSIGSVIYAYVDYRKFKKEEALREAEEKAAAQA